MAEPLGKIDRITMVNTGGDDGVGVSKMTGEIAKVITQVPPVVESLTGVNMAGLVQKLRGEKRPGRQVRTRGRC